MTAGQRFASPVTVDLTQPWLRDDRQVKPLPATIPAQQTEAPHVTRQLLLGIQQRTLDRPLNAHQQQPRHRRSNRALGKIEHRRHPQLRQTSRQPRQVAPRIELPLTVQRILQADEKLETDTLGHRREVENAFAGGDRDRMLPLPAIPAGLASLRHVN